MKKTAGDNISTSGKSQAAAKKKSTGRKKLLGPTAVEEALCTMYPVEWLRETARSTGMIMRERVIDPAAMFWVLVLSFGVDLQRTLASLKRGYEKRTGRKLSDGSWYERFTPELVDYLKACVLHGINELSTQSSRVLSERLSRFKDVLAKDSSIIRLHEALAKKWPATRSRKAAAGVKISVTTSAVANGPKSVAIYGERTNEIKTLRIGPWVKDIVMLLDLGFFKHHLFARIAENGGYFVSRLKENSDPKILRVLKKTAGNAIDLVGARWSWIRDRLKRETLDAEVEIAFSRREYKGETKRDMTTMRLIAVRDEESGEYHAYLTNIPLEMLKAEEIATLYGMRWEIELIFKELKSRYAMDMINTTNPQVVEALIWTAILTMLVSRRLHHVIRNFAPHEQMARYTHLRWATIFIENASDLLTAILKFIGIKKSMTLISDVYSSQALNPHVSRPAFTAECWS